jgi:hypothetical protein
MKLNDVALSANLVDTRFTSSTHYKTEVVAASLSTPDLLALSLLVVGFVWVAVTYIQETRK